MKKTRSPLDQSKKTSGRLRPINYLYTFYQDTSNEFLGRISYLYSTAEASIKYRNNMRWARCCHCIEGRVDKGSLNHPEEEMITMKDLFSKMHIKTEDDLLNYMKKNLPRNQKGEILLPQINMKHPTAILVNFEIDDLKEKHAEVEDENRLLKVEIKELKQQADAASKFSLSLSEKISELEEKLDLAKKVE